jgi:hypothetical protein
MFWLCRVSTYDGYEDPRSRFQDTKYSFAALFDYVIVPPIIYALVQKCSPEKSTQEYVPRAVCHT